MRRDALFREREKLRKFLLNWNTLFKVEELLVFKTMKGNTVLSTVSKGSLRELGGQCLMFISTCTWYLLWMFEMIVNSIGKLSFHVCAHLPKLWEKHASVCTSWLAQPGSLYLTCLYFFFLFSLFFICGWFSRDGDKIQRRPEKLYMYC